MGEVGGALALLALLIGVIALVLSVVAAVIG